MQGEVSVHSQVSPPAGCGRGALLSMDCQHQYLPSIKRLLGPGAAGQHTSFASSHSVTAAAAAGRTCRLHVQRAKAEAQRGGGAQQGPQLLSGEARIWIHIFLIPKPLFLCLFFKILCIYF